MRIETRSEKESKPIILGDYTQISSICKLGHVDRIIVALDERRGKFPVDQLLFCRLKGIRVDDGMVFNIGGNKYRLVASVHFNRGKVYIRHVLTHAEYDRGGWKK